MVDIFVAAARSAAVRISPPLAGREDILKRLAPTPFRGCGVRPPALATRPACRVPASVGTTEAVDKRVISSRLWRSAGGGNLLRRSASGGNLLRQNLPQRSDGTGNLLRRSDGTGNLLRRSDVVGNGSIYYERPQPREDASQGFRLRRFRRSRRRNQYRPLGQTAAAHYLCRLDNKTIIGKRCA